jgi:deoxyribodipyrimidine photo-lyase
LLKLADKLKVTTLWFNHEYPLNESLRDQEVITAFNNKGISSRSFHGDLIQLPGSVRTQTQTGNMHHVFSPFARQWRKQLTDSALAVLPPPRKQSETNISSDDLWPVKTTSIHKKIKCLRRLFRKGLQKI